VKGSGLIHRFGFDPSRRAVREAPRAIETPEMIMAASSEVAWMMTGRFE
jgi:hypothetical protein